MLLARELLGFGVRTKRETEEQATILAPSRRLSRVYMTTETAYTNVFHKRHLPALRNAPVSMVKPQR